MPGNNWSGPRDGIIVVPLGHTCIINSSLIRDACPTGNLPYDEDNDLIKQAFFGIYFDVKPC